MSASAVAPLPADWDTAGAFLTYPAGSRDMFFVGPRTIRALMYDGARGINHLPADVKERVVPVLGTAGWIEEPAPGWFIASDAVLEQALALPGGAA